MTLRWYVVQAKSNQESVVAYHLKNQRLRCYLPQFKVVKRIRGVDTEVTSVMFPSYLFVQFDIKKTKWRSINGTRGVVKVLSSTEDSAIPVPKGFVEAMIAKSDRKGFIAAEKAEKIVEHFSVGDVVQVKEGVFQGLSGTCLSLRKDCAIVLMALLSGRVGVRFPLNTIRVA